MGLRSRRDMLRSLANPQDIFQMDRFLPLAATLIALTPSLAQADTVHFPPRRPGLWVNTMKSGMGHVMSKTCTSRDTD